MPTIDSSHEPQSSGATSGSMNAVDDDRATKLVELRADLAALVDAVKNIVEDRATHALEATMHGAEAGVDFTRETIRSHPISAIAIAAIVGASIAVALIPAPRQSRIGQLRDWAPDVTRENLGEMATGLQRSAASTGSSLLSTFEKVVDSVSTIDAKSSLTPALEKAAAWLGSLRGTATGK